MDIGFIGLGNMGFPMARRLIEAGHGLVVFDTRKEVTGKLEALGAKPATSPKDVADQVETVMASLPSLQASLEVATGANGVIEGSRAKRFIDLSTVGSAMAVKIHGLLAKRNIVQIDCPVSGGVGGAEKGTLAVMVSGPKAEFELLRPALDVIGKVFFIGEKPGAAQTMKLANNFLSATAIAATSEAVVMGVKAGLDPAVMIDVINAGSGMNTASRDKFPARRAAAQLRLRLRHGVDGEGRAAGARGDEAARPVDGGRRRGRAVVGDRDQRGRRRVRFHRGDQADREEGGRCGGWSEGWGDGEVAIPISARRPGQAKRRSGTHSHRRVFGEGSESPASSHNHFLWL
ncbi:3-hydroxyisobutyrate dehydrogenase-like beta-hydroxyacid dehydrogenase [Bradyrhizobium ottawaense]